MAYGYTGFERQDSRTSGEGRYSHRIQQAGLMMVWPFRKPRNKSRKDEEIKGLELEVSRERTKLYSNLDHLDRVVQSPAFDTMVQRSLKLLKGGGN